MEWTWFTFHYWLYIVYITMYVTLLHLNIYILQLVFQLARTVFNMLVLVNDNNPENWYFQLWNLIIFKVVKLKNTQNWDQNPILLHALMW